MEEKLELAFSFAAGEFLDEELEYMKIEYGDIDFITKGKYVCNKDKDTHHYHEWWAPQKAIDEINALIEKKKSKMKDKLFYRVHHPRGLGLWYNEKAEFTHEIGKLELGCAGLEMGQNEECAGGFLSCTDSMDSLFDWFGREELFKLKDNGYNICIFKAEEHKFHEKYKHFLFKQEGSILVATINIV